MRSIMTAVIALFSFITICQAQTTDPDKLYHEGTSLFRAGDYAGAKAKFDEALAAHRGGEAEKRALVWNIARSCEEMGDTECARKFFKIFLGHDVTAEERKEAESRLARLDTAKPATSSVAVTDVPNVVNSDSEKPTIKAIEKSESPPLSRSTWGYIALGGAAALAGTGTVFGMMSFSEEEKQKETGDGDKATFERDQTLANISFLLALGSAGVGTYLLLTDTPPESPTTSVGLSGSGLTLLGQF